MAADPGRNDRLFGDLSGVPRPHDDLSADPGKDAPRRPLLSARNVRLSAAAVFGVFFIGASAVQFIAFISGRTPFPKWYCVFNLLLAKAVFNSVRQLGNNALINGIGTSNMSLGAIVMFTALLLGWKKYVGERGIIGDSNAFFRGRQQAGTDHIR